MNAFTRVVLVSAFVCLVSLCISAQQYSAWSAPVNLGAVINTDVADYQSCISKDGFTLYFTSNRPHGNPSSMDWDIYVSKRASIGAPWVHPKTSGRPSTLNMMKARPVFHSMVTGCIFKATVRMVLAWRIFGFRDVKINATTSDGRSQ
jgi:hypothetical protein